MKFDTVFPNNSWRNLCMKTNATVESILARRSYKAFKSDPISDEILETIINAAKYAPTGMNRQGWHFTVVRSEAGKQMYKKALQEMQRKRGPVGPPPRKLDPGVVSLPEEDFRGAPILIIVSADCSSETCRLDCLLATENMFIAAASFGIMSGWTHMTVKDLFSDPEVKKQFKIPEGYDVCSAAFFGYPLGASRDRGPRKEGTVTIL
jgi:nitroreductase